MDLQTQVLPHFLEEKQFRGGKKGGAKESWEKEQRESKYIIINMRMVNINMRMEKYEKSENIKRWVTVRELGGGGHALVDHLEGRVGGAKLQSELDAGHQRGQSALI